MPDKNITFEIQEHYGVIGKRDGGWNKELNLIKWNGGPAKYDIREWDEHHERMSRGVTLSPWEMRAMVDIFISRNNSAAVSRGRAIESERNARRLAARREAEAARAAAEREAMEGAVPPAEEEPSVMRDSPLTDQGESTSDMSEQSGGVPSETASKLEETVPETMPETVPEPMEEETSAEKSAVMEGSGYSQEADF